MGRELAKMMRGYASAKKNAEKMLNVLLKGCIQSTSAAETRRHSRTSETALSTQDQSHCIQHPAAAIVRDESGEQRVEIVLLAGCPADEKAWDAAFTAAVKSLAKEIVARGDHGRSQKELQGDIVAHLDRDAMAASLGRGYLVMLTREIKTHLEIDLDIRLGRVDTSRSGFIKVLFLTVRLCDAATVFNCMASISHGDLEQLRNRTGAMRNWEWGLLLYNFIGCIDRVCRKRTRVIARLSKELCSDKEIFRNSLIDGLDQRALKSAIYGPFAKLDRLTGTLH
jgi:hypothetical protein